MTATETPPGSSPPARGRDCGMHLDRLGAPCPWKPSASGLCLRRSVPNLEARRAAHKGLALLLEPLPWPDTGCAPGRPCPPLGMAVPPSSRQLPVQLSKHSKRKILLLGAGHPGESSLAPSHHPGADRSGEEWERPKAWVGHGHLPPIH